MIDKVSLSSEVPTSVHRIGIGGEENESIFKGGSALEHAFFRLVCISSAFTGG